MKTRQQGPDARQGPRARAPRPGLPRPLALAVACLFAAQPGHGAGPAPTLPGGLQVVQGQAALATAGDRSMTRAAADTARKQEDLGMPACLLVPDAIRTSISRLVRRVAPRLQVLAHSEIPETHTIRIGPILKGASA